MKEKKIGAFQAAGTYIGTVVGAGFASGQEILQFFVSFGRFGFFGLLVATALFAYFGYIVMDLGWKLKAVSHLPVVRHVGGKVLGSFSDIIITFFLFGALTAMIAGTGALFSQEFGLHPLLGSLFMAVITVITVIGGFNNVITSVSVVVPFLIFSAIAVSIVSVLSTPPNADINAAALPRPLLLRNWLWSSILYVSYNILPSISILGPLGYKAQNRKVIRDGAILGGIGLGIGAVAIFYALYANIGLAGNMEVPMIMVARSISPLSRAIYAVILLAEIYTTAAGNLYGFAARLCDMNSRAAAFVILGSSILAFTASLAGFSNLVRYLYPSVGYCGIITLSCIVYYRYKS